LGVNSDVTSRTTRLTLAAVVILGLCALAAPSSWPLSASQTAGPPKPAQAQAPPVTKPTDPTRPTQTSGSPGRPGPLWEWEWWKDADVQKELGLTDAKVKNINRIFEDRVRRSQALAEKYEAERAELNRVTEARQLSVEAYTILVTQVEALRTELNKGRLVMLYRIYRELTPEQNQKVREIREKRMNAVRSGRGGGRGTESRR
jgi:Spy/CpxP family protein refolding chaperone